MDLQRWFEPTMALTCLCAGWTALWLWWHARFQAVLAPLSGFSLMMALWCGGHLALQHQHYLIGQLLILANPLMPTFFLQFALRYVDSSGRKWLQRLRQALPFITAASLLVVLLSWSLPSSSVLLLADKPVFFIFAGFGWFNLAYTVFIGILAHWMLWLGRHEPSANKRRSLMAISMTAGLGLLLATSFVFPSFGFNWFPYPMLLLPGYLVLLVYSVLRYQMLAVNAFATRALLYVVMALLIVLGVALSSVLFAQLGMPALASVPGWQLWLYSSVLLLLATASYRPVARFAERLIYPGVQMNEQMVNRWQAQLAVPATWGDLAETAAKLISEPLKQRLQIRILPADVTSQAQSHAKSDSQSRQPDEHAKAALQSTFYLECIADDNRWHFRFSDDVELTPTLKLTTEVFGALLCSACASLERSLALAAVHKQQLSQQHLIELGALAAAMAHELRNPLNIISMASAAVDDELRGHIQTQLKRADRLIADMLVYAGRLQIQLQTVQLKPLLQSVLTQWQWSPVQVELLVADDLQLTADPYRLQQVFINLLDNAHAFLRNEAAGRLQITAFQLSSGWIEIRVQNNGPSLDAQLLQGGLFRPFVSKRPGGSGLGLAIVKRIIDAHQGRIEHRQDLGFNVSFVLTLPAAVPQLVAELPFADQPATQKPVTQKPVSQKLGEQ